MVKVGVGKRTKANMRIRNLPQWKRALIFSSLGAGAALMFAGRKSVGVAVAGVGVGVLVAENREILGKTLGDLPGHLETASQAMNMVSLLGERFMAARGR